jgi:phage terminase Nu1 subunit (DNA packaging protein)
MAEPPDAASKTPKTLSVNGYAARKGVDRGAVRKAILNGRLSQSISRDAEGRPKIADVALADREWEANRPASKAQGPGFLTIAEEKRRLTRAQARKLEMANRKQAGVLVPGRAAEIRYATMVVTAKTKLRGLPSRVKQRIPHLTLEELAILAELIDEALEELASGR